MRFAIVFAALTALVAAQGTPPNCLVNCSNEVPLPPSCQPTDNACLCSNSDFVAASTQCLENTCSSSDLSTAEQYAAALCAAAGVTGPASTTQESSASPTTTAPASAGSSTSSNSQTGAGVMQAPALALLIAGLALGVTL